MCLIALALAPRPELALVVIANRDESYARPTEPMHRWADGSGIVAGRDLERGGTWMGVREGRVRFAAVTNVRDPFDMRPKEPGEASRGDIVREVLSAGVPGEPGRHNYVASAPRTPPADIEDVSALAYAARVATRAMRGFNLLALDDDALVWCSNRGGALPMRLTRGVHGLSNAAIDTPWPKVERAKALLATELGARGEPSIEALFGILADDARPPDAALPDTGVGLAIERELAPIRIAMPTYGTRCATVLIARTNGEATLIERTIAPTPGPEVRFDLAFPISPRVWAR